MGYLNTFLCLLVCGMVLVVDAGKAKAQSAESLKQARNLYVGSLGSYEGSQDLRRDLLRYLKKSSVFHVVSTPAESDAVVEGRGELWVRGYHALSPRARINSGYAEAVYGGYLSVNLRGKNDEILWSYFADPRRVTVHELKRDLVDEVVTRLEQEHNDAAIASPQVQNSRDVPTKLRGAGGTFAYPIYEEWFKSFHGRHPAWSFEYSAVGSEAGMNQLMAGTVDFAGSEIAPAALPESARAANNFFPSVGGAVVLVFNLPEAQGELRLTAEVISDLFSGSIRSWNDPKLKALNPDLNLPSAPIHIVYRADGSGTTFAFTDYLSRLGTLLGKKTGASTHLANLIGKGVNGNGAVAEAVAAEPYSLGYTEFLFAFNHHLSFASVRNQAGRFIRPDLLSIMAAANKAGDSQEELEVSIVNSPEASAYPISTLTWIVVPKNLAPEKKEVAMTFLEWMLTSGQRQCSGQGYAPLPRNLVDRELGLVQKRR